MAPRKQSSVSTLADALKCAGGEISQIQMKRMMNIRIISGMQEVAFAARNDTGRMFQAPALRDLTIFTNSCLRGVCKRQIVFGKQEIDRAILRGPGTEPMEIIKYHHGLPCVCSELLSIGKQTRPRGMLLMRTRNHWVAMKPRPPNGIVFANGT